MEQEDAEKLAVSMRELRDRIAEALDVDFHNVKLEIAKNDNGAFTARFAHGDAPYLRWEIEIPAAVASDKPMFSQAAFNDFKDAMAGRFKSGLEQAKAALKELDHWQEYDTRATYDAGKDRLTIHHDEFHLHPTIDKISKIPLAELPDAIDDAVFEILVAAEDKMKAPKTALKEKCDGLRLNCVFEKDVAHISGTGDGAQFTHDVSVSYHDRAALDAIIGGGLAGAYETFRNEQGEKKERKAEPAQEEKLGFNLTRFPKIAAQRDQAKLRLADATDMQNVRNAMIKLQSIEFTAKDEKTLDYAFASYVNYGVVKSMLNRALKAIDRTPSQLLEEIENLGVASPLLSPKDGISRPNALKGLQDGFLPNEGDETDKLSGKYGAAQMIDVYPEQVASILHIIDYLASQKAEKMGVKKIMVELDEGIIPKGIEPKALRRQGKYPYLGPQKPSSNGNSNGNGHASKATPAVNPPRFTVPLPKAAEEPVVFAQETPVEAGVPELITPLLAAAALATPPEIVAPETHTPAKTIHTPDLSEPEESETVMQPEKQKRKHTHRVEVKVHEQNGQSEPSYTEFGDLVSEHRFERGMDQGAFATAIVEKARNSKKPLDEVVNAETVRKWEDYEGLPTENTLLLMVKVLIDDNEKIPVAEKKGKTDDLIAAYESAALAFSRLEQGRGQLGDMSKVKNFISKVDALREQVDLAGTDFHQAINDASGPNISENLEEVDWKFVHHVERKGRQPSPGMAGVMGDVLHAERPFKTGERGQWDDSYEKTFAEQLGKRLTDNPEEVAIKANFIAAKAKLRSFFDDNSGTEICKRAYPEDDHNPQYCTNMATNFFGKTEIRTMRQKQLPDALAAFRKLVQEDQLKKFDAACKSYTECFAQMDTIEKSHGR